MAVYYVLDGMRSEMTLDRLKTEDGYALSKNVRLFDDHDEDVFVRGSLLKHARTEPHFLHVDSDLKNRVQRKGQKEPDSAHQDRINYLVKALSRQQYDVFVENYKCPPRCMFKATPYSWFQEASRIMLDGSIVRHDIFGHAINPSASLKRPGIAIEVVHTHWPDQATLTELCKISENQPLVIAFDFIIPRINVTFRLNQKESKITLGIYIWRGRLWNDSKELVFWDRGVPHPVTTSEGLAHAAGDRARRHESGAK